MTGIPRAERCVPMSLMYAPRPGVPAVDLILCYAGVFRDPAVEARNPRHKSLGSEGISVDS